MAFYKSKYTGTEIDQRLAQATYDDAVLAGFEGTKEEFDAILGKLKEIADKAENSTQMESENLETFNKNIVDAINELHRELQAKPDEQDVIDQGELQVFKDEIAAKYATRDEFNDDIENLNSKISTLNTNLVESVNTINKNVNDSLTIVNQAIQQNAETLVAEIEQRKEGDTNLQKDLQTLNQNLVQSINQINENVANGFNTINGAINDELRPNIENNKANITQLQETVAIVNTNLYESVETINTVLNNAINTINGGIATEISDRQNADAELDSKKLDSDKLLSGAGINIREEDGKKIVDVANDTLTKIQYSDSEVRRLEKDKISYAYDEKTQSNINVILPEGGSYLGNYGDENATVAKAAVYDGIKQLEIGSSKVYLNLNSLDKPTIETPDGKENLVVESDIELMPIEVNFPIRTSGGSDGPEDRVYTQEEILEWFGVADIAALKTQIANKGIQYIKYGIMLMGNPYYYRMPVQYTAFESANQIKLVFIGLNTNNDVASKYEIIINLDGTIIEGNSNVKVTITSIESKDIDLSTYATKEELNDYALKSELPDTSEFATTEALDTKADKTELESVVKYTDISDADDTPRKTIMLDNNDTLSAYNTTGTANNIAMISKWDVVDLGSTGLPINLNGSKERPTYNDDAELALVSDIPDVSRYATTTELTSLRSELQQTETGVATANSEIEKLQSGKQSIQDESLQTTNKTVIGAINELLAKIQELEAKVQALEKSN